MEHDAKLKRLIWACVLLAAYVIAFVLIHGLVTHSSIQRAEFKAVISSLPERFHESMTLQESERLSDTLESLQIGGEQPLLGLDFKTKPLDDYLGADKFDVNATVALLKDNQLRSAETKLRLLATKLTRANDRRARLISTLSDIGVALAVFLAIYALYAGFRMRRHWSDEITFMSEADYAVAKPSSFNEHLQNVVSEEATFTGHPAVVEVEGISLEALPEPFFTVAEQVIEQLVRNSVEHGGRPTEQRVMAGKPEGIVVSVTVRETQEAYHISVRDDGEGLDPVRIKQRALDLNLLNKEVAAKMSAAQAIKLIFLPGFHSEYRQTSLAENDQSLSELRLLVKTLGGVFSLQNEPGEYCQIRLTFPKDLESG